MKLYGKGELKRLLDSLAEKGRLPHAILFSGNEGCGRKALARYTAELFLCEHHACGECAVCRNIENDNHPDVIFVKRLMETGKYSVDAMRHDIVDSMVVMPTNGSIKIYVFEDCETMNQESFNTLLKVIEEPLDYLRFVFTSSNTSAVAATIMSRVTEYEVPDMSAEDCARLLEDKGIDKDRAEELALTFSGNAARCFAAIEGGEKEMKTVNAARAAAGAIGRRDGYGLTTALAPLTAAKAASDDADTSSKKSSPKSSKKTAKKPTTGRNDFSAAIDLLANIVRGALVLKTRGGGGSFFCKKEAERIAAEYSQDEIMNMLDVFFEMEKNESCNINLALSGVYLASRIL